MFLGNLSACWQDDLNTGTAPLGEASIALKEFVIRQAKKSRSAEQKPDYHLLALQSE